MKRTKLRQYRFWNGFIFLFAVIAVQAAVASGQKTTEQTTFGFDKVVKQAADLSQKSYDEKDGKIPDFLNKVSYDQWRDIRYKPEKILWRKQGGLFRVGFFHPGFIYNKKVKINIIDGSSVKPVSFSRDLFHYGMNDFKDKITPETGFAGFRIAFPLILHPFMMNSWYFWGPAISVPLAKG